MAMSMSRCKSDPCHNPIRNMTMSKSVSLNPHVEIPLGSTSMSTIDDHKHLKYLPQGNTIEDDSPFKMCSPKSDAPLKAMTPKANLDDDLARASKRLPKENLEDDSPVTPSESCWTRTAAPRNVLIAVVIGTAAGRVLAQQGLEHSDVMTLLKLPGTLWLKSLQCIVLPLIICSMISSMVTLRGLPDSKRVCIVFVLYLGTTIMAVCEGCFVAKYILGPNVLRAASASSAGASLAESTTTADPDAAVPPAAPLEMFLSNLQMMVPGNIFKDLSEGKTLPVIVTSVVVGLLIRPTREDGSPTATLEVVEDIGDVTQRAVQYIMQLTPLGVGSLVLGSMAAFDMEEAGGVVGVFIGSVAAGLAMHTFIVYPLMLLFLGGRNPIKYYANILSPLLAAFGASSTAVALPISIETAVEKNGVRPHIASFVLSLGATVNMDGTSLYLICSTYFLGVMEGVTFNAGMFVTMSLIATLCSIGMAPVPSASLVFLATITSSIGVPLGESFGLIVAVDWLLDRLRTITNMTGDHAVCGVVDKYLGAMEHPPDDMHKVDSSSRNTITKTISAREAIEKAKLACDTIHVQVHEHDPVHVD